MNFFLVSVLIGLSGAANQESQDIVPGATSLTLADVYGAAPIVDSMEPHVTRKRRATTADCSFSLDVYILQDATASFQDNFAEMKNVQLPLLVEAMEETHPGTRFGVMSFRDKPIWSLGEPASGDWCERFEAPLSEDVTPVNEVYDRLISTGGGDPSENQFGALVAASQSPTPGWNKSSESVRLIVLATDAPPHFDNDGLNAYGMVPFSGTFDEANADAQCLQQYYPTPAQVRSAIQTLDAYVAFLIFDGWWWSELPTKSWEWFNAYIGQTSEFVEPLGDKATGFFQSLAEVIRQIESIECSASTTEEPVTTSSPGASVTAGGTVEVPPTTETSMTETSIPLTVTVAGSTIAETSIPLTVTVAGTTIAQTTEHECPPCPGEVECPPCPPHPDECEEGNIICRNGVYVKLGYEPKDVEIVVDGEVLTP